MRCWVKSRNERNPRLLLPADGFGRAGLLSRDRRRKPEEGGDDVKSACPLCPGLHACYNGEDKGLPSREAELIPQTSSQFGSESATRLREAGIASNGGSAMPP